MVPLFECVWGPGKYTTWDPAHRRRGGVPCVTLAYTVDRCVKNILCVNISWR